MADIRTDPEGRRLFDYRDAAGRRRRMRLGRMALKQARKVPPRVESLVACLAVNDAPDADLARWVAGIGDELRSKLADHGLVEARKAATLGAFTDAFIERRRPSVKPYTLANLKQCRGYLVGHFKESRDLRSITPADADDWAAAMLARPLAENTVRRATGRARQMFTDAIRRGLAEINPFADLPAAVRPNRGRDYFVSREEAAAVLDACPDAEWRVLFALARFGGLRTPSEPGPLKWSDIDWSRGRFRVPSRKTEHHEGGAERIVPIFPALLPHLREAWEAAPEGAEYVVPRASAPGVNLRTGLQRIIHKAGLTPWPKLWQNLRATCETELVKRHPMHLVTAWLGHSAKVAARHYLQVTDADYAAAAGMTPDDAEGVAQHVAQQGAVEAAQYPAEARKNRTRTQETAMGCGLMPVTGVEPVLHCWNRHLKTARLPIPPYGLGEERQYRCDRGCVNAGACGNPRS